jgi:serine protease Do
MKRSISLTTALAALFPLAAFAQQSPTAAAPQPGTPAVQSVNPVPPVPPAPPAPPPRHMHEHDDRPKEPVTFLGVETSDVPRVLSEQMNLPRGFGVVVDYVVPKSPAAEAGLQRSDIIRMLNDQIIVSPGQLGVLVRSFTEGTSVTLTILRKGQEMKLPVKLTKHQTSSSQRAGSGGDWDWDWDWDWDDDGRMNFNFQVPDMTAVKEAVARAKEQAMRAGDQARQAARQLRIVTTNDDTTRSTRVDLGNASISFSDDKGELKLESHNGNKVLTAKDPQGKVLFQGPVNTEEEKAKVPAEVRERFEKLQRQDWPEVPAAPEPPEPPEGNESAQIQPNDMQHAAHCASGRTGWVRSTMLL